jgi:N-acyl-D-aspartate/D-glutamate deacylase
MASSFDLVIKRGWTVDGTGNPWVRRDIGIRGGNITRPGHITVNSGETEVQNTPEGEIAKNLFCSVSYISVF